MDNPQNKSNAPFVIKGDWAKLAEHLKMKFPKLTDVDLKFETGKEYDLIERLAGRLHKRKFEIMNFIKLEIDAIK